MPDVDYPHTSPGAAPSYGSGHRLAAIVPGRAFDATRAVAQLEARWRPRIAALLLLVCILLLAAIPLRDWLPRALLALLVVSAAGLAGGSLWSARAEGLARRPAGGGGGGGGGSGVVILPASPPLSPGSPRRPGVLTPGHAAPGPACDPTSVPSTARTPVSAVPGASSRPLRIGKGSKAHTSVWRLPARPVQSGVAADEAQIGDLAVRAASVVGAGHRLDEPGVPRQDAYRIARDVTGGCLVVAVADGVSSGSYSEIGAAAAVAASVSQLCHQLADPQRRTRPLDFRATFEQAAAQVLQTANQRRLAASDVATVLMTCAVPAFSHNPDGSRTVWFAWVGDLSAWILRDGRWTHAAGDLKQGAGGIVSNAVAHALPQSPAAVRTDEATVRPGDVLLVVSDGIGDAMVAFPQLREYLAGQWQCPPAISDFLADLEFEAPQSLDDRTGVAVWVGDHPVGRGGPA